MRGLSKTLGALFAASVLTAPAWAAEIVVDKATGLPADSNYTPATMFSTVSSAIGTSDAHIKLYADGNQSIDGAITAASVYIEKPRWKIDFDKTENLKNAGAIYVKGQLFAQTWRDDNATGSIELANDLFIAPNTTTKTEDSGYGTIRVGNEGDLTLTGMVTILPNTSTVTIGGEHRGGKIFTLRKLDLSKLESIGERASAALTIGGDLNCTFSEGSTINLPAGCTGTVKVIAMGTGTLSGFDSSHITVTCGGAALPDGYVAVFKAGGTIEIRNNDTLVDGATFSTTAQDGTSKMSWSTLDNVNSQWEYINTTLAIHFTADNQTFTFDNTQSVSLTSLTVTAAEGVTGGTIAFPTTKGLVIATTTAINTNVTATGKSALGAVTVEGEKTTLTVTGGVTLTKVQGSGKLVKTGTIGVDDLTLSIPNNTPNVLSEYDIQSGKLTISAGDTLRGNWAGGGAPSFTVAGGAHLVWDSHDIIGWGREKTVTVAEISGILEKTRDANETFSGRLLLKNGGELRLSAQNDKFMLYNSAIIAVDANATAKITGNSLRMDNGKPEINVGEKATLNGEAPITLAVETKKTGAGTWVQKKAFSGNGALTIEGGTLRLDVNKGNDAGDYTHALPEGKVVTVNQNCIFELYNGYGYFETTGKGLTKVTGDFYYGIRSGNATNTIGTALEVTSGSTLYIRDWRTYRLTPPTLRLDGAIVSENYGTSLKNFVVAPEMLSGSGSIGTNTLPIALSLPENATIDTAHGAVTVNGAVTLPSALKVKIAKSQDVVGSVTLLNATEATIPGGMAVTVMVGETVGENLYAVTHDAENDIVKLTVKEHPAVTAMVSAGDTSLSEALDGAELAAHTILTIDFGDKGDSEAQPGTFTFDNPGAVSFAKIIVKGTNGGKITKTGETVTTASLTVNTSATLANSAVAATDKVTIAENCVLTYEVGNNMTVNATHTGSGSIAVTSAGVVDGGKLKITKTCEVNVEVNSSASLVVNVDPAFDGDTFTKALADNVTVSGNGSVFLQQGIAYAKFTVSHVEVGGTYYLGIGGTAEAPVGSFTPASLTVDEGAALKVRAYRTYSLKVNAVHVNVKGSIARDGGTVESTVTLQIASGATLSGTGTIDVPVTFEEGGLLDVSQGALGVSSVTGTVTLTGDMAAVQPVLYTTQGGVTFADIPGYKVPWVQSCYYWLVKDTAKELSAVAPAGESPTAWSALPWKSSDDRDVSPNIFMLGLDLTANVSAAADGVYVALNMPATYYAKTDLTLSGNFSPILYENSDSTAGNFKSLTVTGSAMVETALLNHVTGDVTVSGVLYPADAKDLFSEINETVAVTKPLKGSGVIVVNDGFTVTLEGALGADGTFGGQLYVGENGSLTLAQSAAQELSGAVEGPGAVLINAPITLTGRLGTVPELAAEAVYSGTLEILSAGSLCFASPTPTKVTGTLRSVKDSAHKLTVGDGTTASVLTVTGTMGTTVAPAEAEAVATTSTYAGYLTVAANSELHLQPTLATTLSASVTGAGKVVIGDGTSATKVIQAATECDISAIDIAAGATYTVSAMKSGIVTLPATTTVTIAEGGKLQVQVATACQMNANVTGAGEVEVTNTATYVFADGPENCLAPGKLTIKSGLTLQANRAENTGLSVKELELFAGGTLTSTSAVVTVANGQVLSGKGSIAAPIVFKDGAIFDAKDSEVGSALRLTEATITWPENGGKVTVRATEPVQLMVFAAGLSKYFTLDAAATAQGLYLSEAKGFVGDDVTMSVLKPLGTDVLPGVVSGNETMKAAIQGEINALAGKGYIITQVTTLKTQNTAKKEMGSAQAVNCFTNLEPTLELVPDVLGGHSTTAVAVVTYDFGVADMTIKSLKLEGDAAAKMYVLLAAKVQNSADSNTASFATGTELTVLNGEKEIIPTSVTAAVATGVANATETTGVQWLAVPLKTLFPDNAPTGTQSLKVKAKNTTTTP